MVIQPLGDKEVYLITNVYGPQKIEDKLMLLTSLEELRERHPIMPWIMGGDFNMIRSLTEKKRRNQNSRQRLFFLPNVSKKHEASGHGNK